MQYIRQVVIDLYRIKGMCEGNINCIGCPFDPDNSGCIFNTYPESSIPEKWNLERLKKEDIND